MVSSDLFRLSGRVAVVTGCSGWLGPAIVDALADAGAYVVAVSRDAERAAASLSRLTAPAELISPRSCDVTTPAWPDLLADVTEEFGRIDVLVNNAHIGRGGSLRTAEPASYVEAADLAVVATATGINAARSGFAKSVELGGSPSVINIASMYGLVSPDPGMYDSEPARNPPFYGVAKAGMLQLTRYAAAELGPLGIRVNSITPGPFPATGAQQNAEFAQRLADRTMLKRFGVPDEIKTSVLFLASPESSFVTGGNIIVDGGWTAW